MSNRKEIKQKARDDYAIYRESERKRKSELSKLSKEERKFAIKQDKIEKKAETKAKNMQIKSMEKDERKQAKKYNKYFKKIKRRPIKRVISSVLAVLLIIGIFNAVPYIKDVSRLLSIELNSSSKESKDALLAGEKVADMISDEGLILLKNEDNTLPLGDSKVNVFGFNSLLFRQGGVGSGGTDLSRSIDFYEGLSNAGVDYNTELYDFYSNHELTPEPEGNSVWVKMIRAFLGDQAVTDEPEIDYLTDDVISKAYDYSNTAIILLSADAVESSDAAPEELKLTDNKYDLIKTVASNFDNVIIIANTGNQIELGVVEEFETIKSVLWVGTPGARGANSVGKVLTGEVNPSGRLTNTYAYDNSTTPANENFGNYEYENSKMHFLNYEEGIYVGYRFYETFYKDNEEAYKSVVQYPFGYGLSYTNFDWEVISKSANDETVNVEVKVTNSGDVAGKEVVQVYYEPPYLENGIEKSAIVLGGYSKTKLLLPGESENIVIKFDTRSMASYDMDNEEAWILDEGTYNINISKNVRNHVDTFVYNNEAKVVYKEDDVTGETIENQFEYASGDLTYLSRSDWEGTYPTDKDTDFKLPQSVIEKIEKEAPVSNEKMPETEVDNNIMLKDLKGLNYNDPKWGKFLDQFSIEQMSELVGNGAFQTLEIEELGIDSAILLDGPSGINYLFGESVAASYPSQIVVGSTWNDELAFKLGEAVGNEANAQGIQGWYAPGMNLHRNEGGGRNFEYFSEDPLLSGKMGAGMVDGAQSKDVIVFMKHFALNDQETNARSGLYVWANEQAIRELYLKPFEITTKEANVHGAMSSFVHFGHKWAGGNEELLQNVLRDEWGFEGLVTTDAVIGSWMDMNKAIRYGNELMLNMVPTNKKKAFKKEYKRDPIGMTIALRERTKNICYSLLNYTDLYK